MTRLTTQQQRIIRFARVVARAAKRHIAQGRWMWSEKAYTRAVERLLRTEHRAVVRLVQQQDSWKTGDGEVWVNKEQLLAALTRYAKGKGKR